MNVKKTTKPISSTEISRGWKIYDAKGQILGRIASQIAVDLMGKNKRNYAPNIDMGDYIVVINAEQVAVSGKKESKKMYQSFSGYPGGLKEESLERLRERKPDAIIRTAVSGMLPKNKLRDPRLARLFIYRDDKHPYEDKFTK